MHVKEKGIKSIYLIFVVARIKTSVRRKKASEKENDQLNFGTSVYPNAHQDSIRL